jgi:hypothetical protein
LSPRSLRDREREALGIEKRPALGGKAALGTVDAVIEVVAGQDDGDEDLIAEAVLIDLAAKLGVRGEAGAFAVRHDARPADPAAEHVGQFHLDATRLKLRLARDIEDAAQPARQERLKDKQAANSHR